MILKAKFYLLLDYTKEYKKNEDLNEKGIQKHAFRVWGE